MLSANSQLLPKKSASIQESISKSKSANRLTNSIPDTAAPENANESLSSNESISSKVSSNSSSGHSTTQGMASNTVNKSKQASIRSTRSQVTDKHQTGLKESSLKFLKRNRIIPNDEGKELRYSPTSLEHLLKTGINYLDTLNTSAVQLEELDKIRCIGLAQQDTVALAQLIKAQETAQTIPQQRSSTTKSRANTGREFTILNLL